MTLPARLAFTIGGGPAGPFYNVTLNGPGLHYEAMDHGRVVDEQLVPTAAQWAELRRSLDAIAVWRWDTEYPNDLGILDGTQWEVDLAYADVALHTHGDNNAPPHFDAFLRAVRRLLGGRAFA